MDLISVIVPVYNVEKYLKRCVESILNQTYSELEVLLIDDGSTDQSGRICEEYSYDPRVRIVHKPNGGLSDARNTGIDLAEGRYLCFVDSDDYIDRRFVETLHAMIVEKGTRIAAANYICIDENGPINKAKAKVGGVEVLSGKEAIYYLYNHEKYANYMWNKMFDSVLFKEIRFPYGRKMEDLGIAYLLLRESNGIAYIHLPLYYYWQRADSIMHTPSRQFYIDYYALTYQRYKDVKQWFPELQINYSYYVRTALKTYDTLEKQDQETALRELKIIWTNNRSAFRFKHTIAYILLRLNKTLYKMLLDEFRIIESKRTKVR